MALYSILTDIFYTIGQILTQLNESETNMNMLIGEEKTINLVINGDTIRQCEVNLSYPANLVDITLPTQGATGFTNFTAGKVAGQTDKYFFLGSFAQGGFQTFLNTLFATAKIKAIAAGTGAIVITLGKLRDNGLADFPNIELVNPDGTITIPAPAVYRITLTIT